MWVPNLLQVKLGACRYDDDDDEKHKSINPFMSQMLWLQSNPTTTR